MTQAVEGVFSETTVRSEGTNIQVVLLGARIGETSGGECRTFQVEWRVGVRFASMDGTTGLRGQVRRIANKSMTACRARQPTATASYCPQSCIDKHVTTLCRWLIGDIIGSVNSIRQISLQSRMIRIVWTS